MHSVNNYQSIRTLEDEEYENEVEAMFENLCDYYADEIDRKKDYWKELTY